METVSFENSRQLFSPGVSPSAAKAGPALPPAAVPTFLVAPMRAMDHTRMLAVITASTAKTVVPVRPKAPRQAVASSGPSTKPPLPPMENRLMPVPLFCPETALAKRAPSG